MSSNHMPDYANTGNNVGRRIVTFRFENTVNSPQEDLLPRLLETELPSIVARSLHAYVKLRDRVKVAKGFWKAVPPIMLEWQGRLAASTNKLHEFLEMDQDERKCTITHVEGHVTWLLDLKCAFEEAMDSKKLGAVKTPWLPDPSVFNAFGYAISTKKISVCNTCKQVAPDRGAVWCCEDYHSTNRRQKMIIYDMRLN